MQTFLGFRLAETYPAVLSSCHKNASFPQFERQSEGILLQPRLAVCSSHNHIPWLASLYATKGTTILLCHSNFSIPEILIVAVFFAVKTESVVCLRRPSIKCVFLETVLQINVKFYPKVPNHHISRPYFFLFFKMYIFFTVIFLFR